jgi:hypothetical protein
MEDLIDLSPSPEVVDSVRKEFGLDERQIKESVESLKEWLRQQPHLPDDLGKISYYTEGMVTSITSYCE